MKLSAAILAALFLASETGIRLCGLVDFPTYLANDEIGYIVKPSQSGRFLDKNAWVFNDRSMGVAESWNPAAKPNLLLIGNSVVMGGDPYNQPEKLGPKLQALVGARYAVWPIGVGGWSDLNETIYLEENPDVAASANLFVWEYMAGGLTGMNRWHSDYVFPRRRPVCATWYVLRRYVLPRFIHFNMNELPPTGPLNQANLARFDAEIGVLSKATHRTVPGILLLYPARGDFLRARRGLEWIPERPQLEEVCREKGLLVVDVAKSPDWNENLYRDEVHPSVAGNAVLAGIIADQVTKLSSR